MSLDPKKREELEAKLEPYVGKDIGPPEVARDEVNAAMIRAWCDAMGDENPVYTDADAAKGSKFGGLVAPPTMLQAWILPGIEMAEQGPPKNEQQRLHALFNEYGYTSVVATNCEQGYNRYLSPGDKISATTTIESISDQKATALGIGYFIDTRTSFVDEGGEEVGWMTFRVLKFVPAQQPQPATTEDGAPAMPTRVRPPMGHDNGWWWEIINQGEVPIQKCEGCGALHHPPRPMCNQCQGTDMGWVPACGNGTVYSYTVLHHPQFPGYDYPVVSAVVELEEGTRLVSEIVECEPDDVYIGMPVDLFVDNVDPEFKMPLFRPAASAGQGS